jgi:iron complex outermembrane receptor protein
MQHFSASSSAYTNRSLAAVMAVAIAFASGSAATAQTAAPSGNDQPAAADTQSAGGDIIVTAQRRSESLLNVPLAVSALGGESLLKQGVTQPTSLASIIPNLQVNDSTGGAEPNFTLRGVGLGNDYSSNQASPVGVYVDDSYLAFRATHGGHMFDLERVEVLRGPQGTLFGRNTTGGAINFITRKPQLNGANGYVDVGYGNFNSVRAEAAGEATLASGTFGIRGAVSYDRHDGYVNNVFPGAPDLGTANMLRTRVSLRYRPSETLDINLRLFANRGHQIQPGVIQIGTGPNGANAITGYTRTGLGFFDVSSDNPHRNTTDSRGGALTIKLDLSSTLSVQSLTSYDTANSLFGQDVDGSPVNLLETIFNSRYSEFNQEMRLVYDSGIVKAQGGVFYGRDRINIDNKFSLLGFLQQLGLPADPTFTAGGGTISQAFTQIRTSKAVFGQADITFVPRLTLTLGARYTEDDARYENGTAFIGGYEYQPIVQTVGTPGNPLNRQGKNSALTGRAALSYQFESGPILYASYNRGYRAGTFNGSGYLHPSQITFVNPERVNAYEIGAKGRFLDGALSLAAAAFYYDYTNQQIQDVVGPVAFLRNAGASTLKGVELEATIRFSPEASFSGSIGYTDSRYDELSLQGLNLAGNALPFTPEVTANGRFDYTINGIAGGKLVLSPSITYTSSQFFTPYNNLAGYAPVQQGAYALVDAVAEYQNGPWALRVWGKNLTDKGYYTYGNNFASFGYNYFNVNQPRTFGIAVRRTF